MTAQLLLMRHGAAEDRSASGRDADRILTPAGREGVLRVAAALRARRGARIARVIASPLARAQETAEIMRDALCPGVEIEADDDLMPDESAYDLAVRAAQVEVETLLVSHMPNIEMVARALAIPPPRPTPRPPAPGASALRVPSHFRTATLIGLEIAGRPPPYALALVIDPAELSTG